MVIAIFVFAFFGHPVWYWLIGTRILLLPVIAGLAYELIRFAGKHANNRVVRWLLAPGLWLQRLTTRQPSLDQLEVSIRALQQVLDRERAAAPGRAAGRSNGLTASFSRRESSRLGSEERADGTAGSPRSSAAGPASSASIESAAQSRNEEERWRSTGMLR